MTNLYTSYTKAQSPLLGILLEIFVQNLESDYFDKPINNRKIKLLANMI